MPDRPSPASSLLPSLAGSLVCIALAALLALPASAARRPGARRPKARRPAVLPIAATSTPSALAPAPPTAPAAPLFQPNALVPGAEAKALDARLQSMMARPGGLTADEVAKRAEDTSIDVAIRRSEIASAAAQVDQAMVAFFPRLSGAARYTRLSAIENSIGGVVLPVQLDQVVFQASLAVPLSDYVLRSMQGLAAAAASRRAALVNEQATRLKVRTDARILYYNWARAVLQQVVTEQALAQVRGHLGDARNLLAAGMASPADVMRVESQAASAELLVERSRNMARVMAEQVAISMSEKQAEAWQIGEDLRAVLSELPEAGADPAPLVTEALDRRLEPHVLDENKSAIVEQSKVVRAGQYPRLDAFGNLGYLNPNPRAFPIKPNFSDNWKSNWDAGLALSWSPNDLAGARASARIIDSQVAQLELQRRNLLNALRAEVVGAWSSMREALVQRETTARGLAASEESYRVRQELWKVGRATAVELTDAETDLTQARLSAVNASIDLRVATVKLTHALGRDVPTSK